MNADAKAPEFHAPRNGGSTENGEVVWQIIKAIQSTRVGQTQIIIRDSSRVEVRVSEAGCSA